MGDAKLGERALASAVEVAFISSVPCMTYFLAVLLGIAGSTVVRPGESWSRAKMTNLWSQVLNWLLLQAHGLAPHSGGLRRSSIA